MNFNNGNLYIYIYIYVYIYIGHKVNNLTLYRTGTKEKAT